MYAFITRTESTISFLVEDGFSGSEPFGKLAKQTKDEALEKVTKMLRQYGVDNMEFHL